MTLRGYVGLTVRDGRLKPPPLSRVARSCPACNAVAFFYEQGRDPLAVVEGKLYLANVRIAVEHELALPPPPRWKNQNQTRPATIAIASAPIRMRKRFLFTKSRKARNTKARGCRPQQYDRR